MPETFDSQAAGRQLNELLLLATLRHAPMHGYQIALEIEQRSGGYFRFQHGTLYPILHRLEREGLIAGDWSDPEGGRARKQYALTQAGHAHLVESVRQWRALDVHLRPFLKAADGQVRPGAA